MAQKPAIIIDNGTQKTKAGFAGDDAPKTEFLTKVGFPRYNISKEDLEKSGLRTLFVGDEAQEKRGILKLRYPVEHGIIDKWDEIEKIWQHTFDKLDLSSKDHPVLLTETANNPKATREKMAEVMMEKFHIPSIFIGIQGVLSLYAAGRQTGTALSIGAGVTQIVPVDKGYAVPGASTCLNLGGNDLRQYIVKLLTESGYSVNDWYHIDPIKEKFCYVALDFDRETESVCKKAKLEEETYEMPDGEIITPRQERFQCPEVLFKPSLLAGLDVAMYEEGIHKVCHDAIAKCDIEVQALLYKNIVLSGGSSLLPGLAERLEKEMRGLVPANMAIEVIASRHRKNSVWIGGSVLASLGTFQEMWVTKEQYEEDGPSVIHKCPSAC